MYTNCFIEQTEVVALVTEDAASVITATCSSVKETEMDWTRKVTKYFLSTNSTATKICRGVNGSYDPSINPPFLTESQTTSQTGYTAPPLQYKLNNSQLNHPIPPHLNRPFPAKPKYFGVGSKVGVIWKSPYAVHTKMAVFFFTAG